MADSTAERGGFVPIARRLTYAHTIFRTCVRLGERAQQSAEALPPWRCGGFVAMCTEESEGREVSVEREERDERDERDTHQEQP